jgi:hypothetical protein
VKAEYGITKTTGQYSDKNLGFGTLLYKMKQIKQTVWLEVTTDMVVLMKGVLRQYKSSTGTKTTTNLRNWKSGKSGKSFLNDEKILSKNNEIL